MWAFFLPLVLLGFVSIQSVLSQVVPEQVSGPRTATAQGGAAAYLAGTHAALAFAEANPGYSGSISASQLAPYATPNALPAGFVAEIQNGQLLAWSNVENPALATDVWNVTGSDCAYGVNTNGTLESPCGSIGAAPTGAPNGSLVYAIGAPQ